MIPYGRQYIDDDDINAVIEVLKSDWLTTGPKVREFEIAVSEFVGSKYAITVSSGTAALHCAMYAIGVRPGDEVILSPMTFVATANCVVYQGGIPVFVDIEEETLLIDPEKIEKKITSKTKAIISVDYAGQPCNYETLRAISDKYNIPLIADSCHALGAEYKGKRAGSLADLTVFSFHPVKHITTGEGGMITTNNKNYAARIKQFRNHGIMNDFRDREKQSTFFYEMTSLGYNYRISDIQCGLGLSQLNKLPVFLKKRQEIAEQYNIAFSNYTNIKPLKNRENNINAYHLYVIQVLKKDRTLAFKKLREKNIGVNVHYIPVYHHPYYKKHFNIQNKQYPITEKVYEQILSLPIHPSMTDEMVNKVIKEVIAVLK